MQDMPVTVWQQIRKQSVGKVCRCPKKLPSDRCLAVTIDDVAARSDVLPGRIFDVAAAKSLEPFVRSHRGDKRLEKMSTRAYVY